MTKSGKLVVFEGVSGTGKETQAKLLQNYLVRKKTKTTVVYHPSPELKEILSVWRKKRKIDNVSEVYFLLADRYNRVQNIINPALAKGEWVISLRNYVSALVYQGHTLEERQWISEEFGRFEPEPDYLFWFDISPDEALKRIRKRSKETGEPTGKFETIKLLQEKRDKYRLIFNKVSHHRIDAAASVAAIHRTLVSCINS